MGLRGDVIVIGVAGIVLLAAGYIASKKLGQVAQKVAPLVDPTSEKNLAYSGVNKVGAALTGKGNFDLGSWLYDISHPNENFSVTPLPPVSLEKLLAADDMGGRDFGFKSPLSWD